MEPNSFEQKQPNSPQDGSIGPAIGIVIIILVVVVGSLYFWSQRMNKNQNVAPVPVETYTPDTVIDQTQATTSTSAELQ